MNPFQKKIIVDNNKIKSIEPCDKSVVLIIEGIEYSFTNCWAYPGFVDSHGHVAALGSKLQGLNLTLAHSAEECIGLAASFKKLRGGWVYGFGWNNELWQNNNFPTKELLDDYFKDTPVYLTRIDGHCAWVNSKALELAGINILTPDPIGGKILREKSGCPTGILLDNAMDLVSRLIPKPTREQVSDNIIFALNKLAESGITEVCDMDMEPDFLEIYKKLDSENNLPVRVNAFVKGQNDEWLEDHLKPYNGKNFKLSGVKFYADGALGSRGAALIEPYSDDNTNGLLLINHEHLYNKCKLALNNGFDVAVHAIGDAGNRLVLEVFAKLFDDGVPSENSNLRLEHAQIIHPDDLHFFSKYRIHASIQPIHCLSDAPMARRRLGSRTSYSYRWKSLIESGALLSAGSDFPIESHNPLTGLSALIYRIPFGENEPWGEAECLTPQEAISAYSLWYNKSTRKDELYGRLAPGKIADITILDRDITTCTADEILETKVMATVCGGKLSYVTST
jgi:predicted amidohydrolase YtcJ